MDPANLTAPLTNQQPRLREDHERAGRIRLTLKEWLPHPIEAELISPDVCLRLAQDEIEKLPVLLGKRQYRLGDFFTVEGSSSPDLELYGDLGRVKWIGQRMRQGSITIHGDAGMHLGSGMSGGSIVVEGDCGDWLGAEMSGGLIHVHGNAGSQVGAVYRRGQVGLRGGEILVDGGAGIELGRRMAGGLICIQGRVGDFAGLEMHGGALVLLDLVGLRPGAWMTAGTIIVFQPPTLLPTFLPAGDDEPGCLPPCLKRLQELGVPFPGNIQTGHFQRFTGDTSELGEGEILVSQPGG